jgi:hypothetical protein
MMKDQLKRIYFLLKVTQIIIKRESLLSY